MVPFRAQNKEQTPPWVCSCRKKKLPTRRKKKKYDREKKKKNIMRRIPMNVTEVERRDKEIS